MSDFNLNTFENFLVSIGIAHSTTKFREIMQKLNEFLPVRLGDGAYGTTPIAQVLYCQTPKSVHFTYAAALLHRFPYERLGEVLDNAGGGELRAMIDLVGLNPGTPEAEAFAVGYTEYKQLLDQFILDIES
jgi:hypothetical protein